MKYRVIDLLDGVVVSKVRDRGRVAEPKLVPRLVCVGAQSFSCRRYLGLV